MERIPVKSTSIKEIGHDPGSQTLEVMFQSGVVYQYPGVPAEAHQALMSAESIGRHFGQHIRDKYKSVKLA